MPKSGKNNERIEQVQRGRKKSAKVEPLRQTTEQPNKLYNDLAKFPSENPYPVLRIHKDGTVLYANKASEPLLKARDSAIGKPAPQEWYRLVEEVLTTGLVAREEVKDNGRVFAFRIVPITGSDYVNFYGADITEQKMAEEEREITIKLLSLINSENQMQELMKLVAVFLRDWSGCEAVGIRLQEGEDFPYFITSGFPEEFVLAENKLCSINEMGEPVRDSRGRVFLECMCGNIISGRFDPSKPFFTEHGSFWTNSTTELLAGTTENDRMAKTRNRCNTAGYESVALVPLRTGKETFGLLQFNSKQRGSFTPEKISLLERLADNLAIGLAQRKAEELLRESENKFKTLADEAFDSIVIHDGERILEVNKAFGKIWGCEPQKAVGAKMDEFVTPASLEVIKDRIRSGYDKPYEVVAVRKDGTRFQVEIAGKSIIYKGKPARIATTRDITKRKRAEEELGKSEESYRVTFENTGTATVLIEDDTTIILANTEFERLSGFSKQEIEGKKSWTEFVVKENLAWMLEQHRLRRENRETAMKQYEFQFITKSGDIRDISLLIDVIPGTKRSVASLMDITARKQAECALQTSEERFRSLFEQAADAIVVIDARTGEMAEFNDKAHQMLGYTRTEYAKLRLSDIDAIESKEKVAAHIDKIVRQGSDIFEAKQRKKDGTLCDVLVSVKLITVAGKPYLQAIWRDITELKKAEGTLLEYQKQLKRLAARLTLTEERERRRIAGKIHDEISQTLAMVKIKLDTLRNSPPSEASAAEIEEISSSVEKVIQETRTLTLELSYPILYELGFEAAVAEWLSEQVQKKHGIATEFQDDGQTKPLDDDVRVLLFRNVRELLINVIKHARAEKVKVRIERIDDSINVTVEDNGAGFAPAEAKVMTTKKTGFGLFSVRESLEELGGRFVIESKPGAGCKAIMTAPLKGKNRGKEE